MDDKLLSLKDLLLRAKEAKAMALSLKAEVDRLRDEIGAEMLTDSVMFDGFTISRYKDISIGKKAIIPEEYYDLTPKLNEERVQEAALAGCFDEKDVRIVTKYRISQPRN
jgi:hypothetical protein